MKAWYSIVRDTELKDGSVRATYVVTFETDNAELKREVEKYLQGIMDRADRKTEPFDKDINVRSNSSEKPNNSTISKMEQVDKDTNVRSKDETQTNADQHVQHVESVEPTWTKEDHEAFYTFLWNVINPNEMQDYIGMFETKTEPQTDCPWK